jgi:hypothetical protein
MNILQSILRAIRGPIIRFLAGNDRTQLSGCKPPAPTIRAVRNGDLGDPDTWIIGGTGPAMVYGSEPQAGEGEES